MQLRFPEHIDRAGNFSQILAKEVLRRFPEWEPFGELKRREFPEWDSAVGAPGKQAGVIVVEFHIPCPSPVVLRGLWLSTANEELTVGFDAHHAHFNDRRGGVCSVDDGFRFISEIVAERIGVVGLFRGDEIGGSMAVELPYELPLALGNTSFTHATLRSWNSKFDRDEVNGT